MSEEDMYNKGESLSDKRELKKDGMSWVYPEKDVKKSTNDLSDSIDEEEKLSDEGKHTAGFREGVKHACKNIRNELKRIMGPQLI